MSSLSDCRIINLPKFSDSRGNLSFIEGGVHVPFDIERIYYLYDVPVDSERGVHAHKKLQQLIFAINGSFDITLDDGTERKTFHLDSPSQGVCIPNMIWRELNNFSEGAVCMVLASEKYDADDYIHEYDEFIEVIKKQTEKHGLK